MSIQSNRYYLDGADMWDVYRVGVESGSDDFLRMPKRKDTITHDWKDQSGLDVDTTRVFVEAKEVELKCHIIAEGEAAFRDNYNRLLAALLRPGIRRITIVELGREFFVIYKECNLYTRFTRIKNTNLVACKFNIKFLELNPGGAVAEHVIDDDGNFLIT